MMSTSSIESLCLKSHAAVSGYRRQLGHDAREVVKIFADGLSWTSEELD